MKERKLLKLDDLRRLVPNDGRWHRHEVWIKNENGEVTIADCVVNAILERGSKVKLDS